MSKKNAITTHRVKCWPQFFEPTLCGRKNFEVRFNDRGYQRGDLLVLCEFDPVTNEFTGRELPKEITYVLSGWGVQNSHVVLGIGDLTIQTSL